MALYLGSTKIAGGGGAGNANIVSCASYEEYEQIPHDPDTMYVTPDEDGQYAVLDEDNEFTGFNKFAAVGAAQDWDDGQPAPDGTVILTDESGQSYNVRLSRLMGAGGGDMIDVQSGQLFYAARKPLGVISGQLNETGITSLYEDDPGKAIKFMFPKNMHIELAGLSAGVSMDGDKWENVQPFTSEPYSFNMQAGDSFYVRTTDNTTLTGIVNNAAGFNMSFHPVLPYIETQFDTVKTVYNVTLDKLLDPGATVVDDIAISDLFEPIGLSGAVYSSSTNYSWPSWNDGNNTWPKQKRSFSNLVYDKEISSMAGNYCGLKLVLTPKVKIRMTCSGMTYGGNSRIVKMNTLTKAISADDGVFTSKNLLTAVYTPPAGQRYFTAKPTFTAASGPSQEAESARYVISSTGGTIGVWFPVRESRYNWYLKTSYDSNGTSIQAWPQNVGQAAAVQGGQEVGMYFRSFQNSFAEWEDDPTNTVMRRQYGYPALPAGMSKYKHYNGSSTLTSSNWSELSLVPYIPRQATSPFYSVAHYVSKYYPNCLTPPPMPSGQSSGYVFWPRQGGILSNVNDSMANWAATVKFTIRFDKNDVVEARAQAQG